MKTLLTVSLLLSSIVSVNAQTNSIIRATDNNSDTHYYYYNDQNQLIWELVGTTRYEYEYNAAGKRTKSQTNLWVANPGIYHKGNYETYEYDASGNVSKTTVMKKPWNKDAYEEDDVFVNYTYEDGFPKTWDNYYKDVLYYNFRNTLTKDAEGNVSGLVTERFDPDAPEKGWVKTKTLTYEYSTLSSSYVPANLTMEDNNGNITLSWSPVAGADKYIVSYDNVRVEVEGSTTFKVTLGTGERQFAVQAVIDGMERNATFCATAVEDPGKKAITDLSAGEISEVVEETESDELTTRTFYCIPLSWTLPEGHSEVVKYNIYYNSKTYGDAYCVSQIDPSATSYTLKIDPFEVADWDEDGNYTTGIETQIFVTVVYTTGESEKSNTITVNPFKELGHENTSISSIVSASASSAGIFNLSGQRIKAANGLIIKKGRKYFVR